MQDTNPSFLHAGAFLSNAISKTLTAPIQFVKIRLQCQRQMKNNQQILQQYKGIIDCCKRVKKQEGIRGFFKGNGVNVLKYIPSELLSFAVYDMINSMMKFNQQKMGKEKYALASVVKGFFAGFLSAVYTYPFEYVRIRLNNDVESIKKPKQFEGIFEVFRKTMKGDGIIGFYRGFIFHCLCFILYRGLYFGMFDTFMAFQSGPQNLLIKFIAGYLITFTAKAMIYPLDTLTKRMMMTSLTKKTYNSAQMMMNIIKNEGVRPLYNGFSVYLISSLGGSMALLMYDYFRGLQIRNNA